MSDTAETIIENMTCIVQRVLDEQAHLLVYDNMLTMCSYAPSAHPKFGPEGRAGLAWRDAVWTKCNEVLADVQAGRRAIPSKEEFLAELPVLPKVVY